MAKPAKKTAKKAARSSQQANSAPGSEITVKSGSTTPTRLQDIERVFDDFLSRRWPRPGTWEWPRWGELSSLLDRQLPSLDIVDSEKEVVVRAELPGIDKKDLDVSVADRTLTIKGSTRKEQKEETENYFRREIRSGEFSRSVLLPADVNAANAESTFKGGVLELRLPKVRAAKLQKVSLTQ
jgi:HSP20 family protein